MYSIKDINGYVAHLITYAKHMEKIATLNVLAAKRGFLDEEEIEIAEEMNISVNHFIIKHRKLLKRLDRQKKLDLRSIEKEVRAATKKAA